MRKDEDGDMRTGRFVLNRGPKANTPVINSNYENANIMFWKLNISEMNLQKDYNGPFLKMRGGKLLFNMTTIATNNVAIDNMFDVDGASEIYMNDVSVRGNYSTKGLFDIKNLASAEISSSSFARNNIARGIISMDGVGTVSITRNEFISNTKDFKVVEIKGNSDVINNTSTILTLNNVENLEYTNNKAINNTNNNALTLRAPSVIYASGVKGLISDSTFDNNLSSGRGYRKCNS